MLQLINEYLLRILRKVAIRLVIFVRVFVIQNMNVLGCYRDGGHFRRQYSGGC
jgi:hypothetical protein